MSKQDPDVWENEDYTGPCFLVAGAPTEPPLHQLESVDSFPR